MIEVTQRKYPRCRSQTDPRDGHVAVCNASDPQLQASAPKPIDDSERGLTLQVRHGIYGRARLGHALCFADTQDGRTCTIPGVANTVASHPVEEPSTAPGVV